jgi:hypothetical protein
VPLTPAPAAALPGFWEAFGHSYMQTTVGTLYQTGRMDAIVRNAMDIEHFSWRNHCVTGAQLVQQGRSQGGHARMLQEVGKSQRTAPYAANGGGCFLVWGINDIGFSGNTTQIRTAWKYALRTCISRWRASSIKEDSDASIAWGAGWVSAGGTQDFSSGTSIRNATATTNANGTITLPADYNGEWIALCFTGAGGVFGGTITFTGTASVVPALQALQPLSVSNITPPGTHCPVTVRVKGTAADVNKTIIMTVASVDGGGGAVGFDCWWLEADNPGPVIVLNVARLTTAGYAGYPTWSGSQAGADADVANFNADLAAVVAEFGPMVQVADIDSALNKGVPPPGSTATTLLASDGVHPNEFGAARCADAVLAAVQRLSPEGGLGTAACSQGDSPQAGAVRYGRQPQSWYMPDFAAWDGTAYTAVQGHMFALPMPVTEGRERWIQAQFEVINTPTTGSLIRWGIYDDVGWTNYPQDLLVEFTSGGAFAIGATAGPNMRQSPTSGAGSVNQAIDPGLYWLVFKLDTIVATAPTIRAVKGPSMFLPATSWVAGTPGTDCAWRVTGLSAGALPGTFPAGAAPAGTAAGSVPALAVKTF